MENIWDLATLDPFECRACYKFNCGLEHEINVAYFVLQGVTEQSTLVALKFTSMYLLFPGNVNCGSCLLGVKVGSRGKGKGKVEVFEMKLWE